MRFRPITGSAQHPHTDIIGLVFLRPAISGQNGRATKIYQIAGGLRIKPRPIAQHSTQHTAHNRRPDRRRMPSRAVACRHMANFMADNAGEFGL